ncbi:MAG: hypothetical protein M2R45_05073 [Verrucomicrobia subdivision 3 bacterium]|nr:hypothetical protein [Limisphaerales bacterium]MCS1417150.1 hypothetical protein [Limisphaerales bacterium]
MPIRLACWYKHFCDEAANTDLFGMETSGPLQVLSERKAVKDHRTLILRQGLAGRYRVVKQLLSGVSSWSATIFRCFGFFRCEEIPLNFHTFFKSHPGHQVATMH